MPKFTLIGEHTDIYGKPDGTKVTYEFYVEGINDVLEHVDLFIRGCGYSPAGILDYVIDDYDTEKVDEELTLAFPDGTEEIAHSDYYYDKDRNK